MDGLWNSSLSLCVGYYRLLKGKCQIEQQELQTATINLMQQIQQGTYISTVGNDELKTLLEKLYQTNRRLVRHSDTKTQLTLEKEWNDLQKSSEDIESSIKQRCDVLRTVSVANHSIFNSVLFSREKLLGRRR